MRFVVPTPLMAAMAICCIGCGDGLSSLQGTVTIDGSPAPAGLSLQFTPTETGGSPSYASTDEHGHYEAAFTFTRKGIEPGRHLVRLIPGGGETTMPKLGPDGKPEPAPPSPFSKLPGKYFEKIQDIQVNNGGNTVDIHLKTAG